MKAKIGVKKRFNIINEKKSMNINPFKSVFFLFEIYKDDKKLKHSNIIKNWSVNIWYSKTLKFKIRNISLVLSFWNNNGAMITVDPLKKYKHSDIQYFFLKEKTVSSLPKWNDATIRNNNKMILGNFNQQIIIRTEIKTYIR